MSLTRTAWQNAGIFEALAAGIMRPSHPIRDPGPMQAAWGANGLIPDGFNPDSKMSPVIRLDNGASTIPLPSVLKAVHDFDPNYGNPHAGHPSAEISGVAVNHALDLALQYTGATETHEAFFAPGHGATAGLNWLAWQLRNNPDARGRTKVIISARSHHATINLRGVLGSENVILIPLTDVRRGRPPTQNLLDAIGRHAHEARAIITTEVDNLMGIFGAARAISEAAHAQGMIHVSDGAHGMGHRQGMTVDGELHNVATAGYDVYATSPHKWYANLSDGLLIVRKGLLDAWSPLFYGGGHVGVVTLRGFNLTKNLRSKHSPGTPNVMGAVAMAAALSTMQAIGPDRLRQHEVEMNARMMAGLSQIDGVRLAGDIDQQATPRAMVWSFIIEGLHYAKAEAWYEDCFATEVRGGCHCAQPAVAALLTHLMGIGSAQMREYQRQIGNDDRSEVPGLIRPAGAAYTVDRTVDCFLAATALLAEEKERVDRDYRVLPSGHAIAFKDETWLARKQKFIYQHGRIDIGTGV